MSLLVDLLDVNHVALGPGPLVPVLEASLGAKLDEAAELSFSVPATDARVVTYLTQAARFRIRAPDGQQGIGIIQDLSATAGAEPTWQVRGLDLLAELNDITSMWFAHFADEDANSVVLPAILSGTGWTQGSVDSGLGNYAGVLNGMSRLLMLQKLREAKSRHLRLGTGTRVLDFGAFGADSGVILTNVDHLRVSQESNTLIGIVDTIERSIDRAGIVTRIFPWGAGNDDGYARLKVTIQDVPASDSVRAPNIRTVQGLRGATTATIAGSSSTVLKVADSTGFNQANMQLFVGDKDDYSVGHYVNIVVASVPDSQTINIASGTMSPPPGAGLDVIGWPNYYIQADPEYASNPRQQTMIFPDIDVVGRDSPSPAWEPAARALYDRVWAHLQWFKQEKVTYQINVLTLPATVKVGDKLRLRYRGVVTHNGVAVDYINIDELLYLISWQRVYTGDGQRRVSLEVSNVNRQTGADALALTGVADATDAVAVRA